MDFSATFWALPIIGEQAAFGRVAIVGGVRKINKQTKRRAPIKKGLVLCFSSVLTF